MRLITKVGNHCQLLGLNQNFTMFWCRDSLFLSCSSLSVEEGHVLSLFIIFGVDWLLPSLFWLYDRWIFFFFACVFSRFQRLIQIGRFTLAIYTAEIYHAHPIAIFPGLYFVFRRVSSISSVCSDYQNLCYVMFTLLDIRYPAFHGRHTSCNYCSVVQCRLLPTDRRFNNGNMLVSVRCFNFWSNLVEQCCEPVDTLTFSSYPSKVLG